VEPLASFFADPFDWQVIANTLKIAGLVTLVCLLIGYPTAFALAWSAGWGQVILLAAIILPLSIGVVVKAFAWQIVLRRDGILSTTLVSLGIWDEPVRLLFTPTGLVLGAANVFLPFMILPIYSVVKLIDPRTQ
jgi:putative spermidine/putrescine transport system permease protein